MQHGVKVNGNYYRDVLLKEKLLPCIRKYPVTISYSNRTVHLRTGRVTQSHFYERRQTISCDQWPPNSPDMNPMDYKTWAVMQERAYEKRVNDVDELCQRPLSVWHSTGQNVIDEAIDQWRECVSE